MKKVCTLFFSILGIVFAIDGAKYLIIAYDPYIPILQPLAEWKTIKGVPAKIVPVSGIGSTPQAIQSYIRNAYNNWPVRPEYVLLVGSPAQIPSYGNVTDCYYGDMSGDYRMEIPVGRAFVRNARECSTFVAKVLTYERPNLQTLDTLYFLKGTTVVREDNPPDPYYQPDSRLVRGFWQAAGYVLCESLLNLSGHSSADVNRAARDGRMFITYRGQGVGNWWSPFDQVTPESWNNREKMPIVVSGTCMTIDLSSGPGGVYGDRFFRAGSPESLGGAVAYFGTSQSGSGVSAQRGACFRGFFTALFQEGEYRLGRATLRGRFWVDSLFHDQTRYQEWNLLGDPELGIWTGLPQVLTVEYDSVIELAPREFLVTVRRDGARVGGANVCLSMDSTVYATGVTDDSGEVRLNIGPEHIGEMTLVVTGKNLLPYQGSVRVVATGMPYLVVRDMSIDDYVGNGDGVFNPGERARLTVRLKNVGGVSASGVSGVLRVFSSRVQVSDSTAQYGTLAPESTRAGDPYEISLDTLLQDSTVLSAALFVRDAARDSWVIPLVLLVRAGRVRFEGAVFLDSFPGGNANGRVGRGESGRLQVALANRGGGPIFSVRGVLTAPDTNLVVVDSLAYYGGMRAGEVKSGGSDRFAISVGPNLPVNCSLRFRCAVFGDGGTYRYSDTLSFQLAGEPGTAQEPTGPDPYGYFCYDDTDTASGRAPTYQWLELAPPGPGAVIPGVSDSDAVTVTLALPFTFQLYGTRDNFISVCSNGFLALGYTTYRRGNNAPIPDTAGPPWMVAPFWDDLNPDESQNGYGTAYQYYDTAHHRLIIEFKDFAHYNMPNIRESFQVALYDPVYYPTPTGDGEIVFQYQRVSLNSSCTVGIEDGTETRGIQYLYNNTYPPTAAYLQAERAIKFTTHPPRTAVTPWLVLSGVFPSDTLEGNRNGRLEPGERAQVSVALYNRGRYPAENTVGSLRCTDGDAVVRDSLALFGLIPAGDSVNNLAQPFAFEITPHPADSILEFLLELRAQGYVTLCYFSLPISGLTGLEEEVGRVAAVTGLHRITPVPLTARGTVYYTLAAPGYVDLALFDVSGRRVATLVRGREDAGAQRVGFAACDLLPGVYFCRLAVKGPDGEKPFVQKLVVLPLSRRPVDRVRGR